MDTLSYKTLSVNKKNSNTEWFVVDAENQTLGRLAARIASIIRGKNKATFTPNADCGDYVIVLNSDKVHLSGTKWDDKKYIRYTGYPGGQRIVSAKLLNQKKPTAIVENAVRGMLPKTKLGRAQLKKLFVYAEDQHPHAAQKPKELKF